MTFSTPPLDPARKAVLRDFLVEEAARTQPAGGLRTLDAGAPGPAGPALDWAAEEFGSEPRRTRRWAPALVAAAVVGVVAGGVVALTGDDGTSPAQQPAGPGPGTASDVRVLSSDELTALGAGRGGFRLLSDCMTAAGWNTTYHPEDESISGELPAASKPRYDQDWVLCSAAAAVGQASTSVVTADVWAALYAHAQQVERCVADLGVPVQPLPDRARFSETYGGMTEWVPYPGDPDALTAEQITGIDACMDAAG